MSLLRRVLLVALLPLVWFPIIALTLAVAPSLPAWAWPVAVLIYVALWVRIRRGRAEDGPTDPNAPAYSPVSQVGY